MRKIVFPAFLSVFALLAFTPDAHAYRGNQCSQTYNMGGSLTVTYSSPCQPAPQVVYYGPPPRPVYYNYYPAPQRVVYYKQKDWHGRGHDHRHDDRHNGRHDDRRDGHRDGHNGRGHGRD